MSRRRVSQGGVSHGHRHRFVAPGGTTVLLEESHVLPMVDVQLVLRTGSIHDPEGLEGVTRLVWRMIRMGTRRMTGPEVEEAIGRLGGRLAVEISNSYVAIHGAVIKRNLEPFLALFAELVQAPAFRAKDLAQVKRETLSDLVALRDNDRALAGRTFRRTLFEDHPYGRFVSGDRRSVRAIQRRHLIDQYEAHFKASNLLLGVAGDVTPGELEDLVSTHFGDLPKGRAPRERVPQPKRPKGRRAIVVDKPSRSQTQLLVGTTGSRAGEPEWYPLIVANTAFGGTFTSELVQEVREKRGWSYGASSRLGTDRRRDSWYMWSSPGASYAVECLSLELELLERLVDRGVGRRDHGAAKRYLLQSHCFDLDTAHKRLEPQLDVELFGLPADHHDRYEKHVRAVTRAASLEAIQKRLSSKHLRVVMVATADEVVPKLEALFGSGAVEVVPYDRE